MNKNKVYSHMVGRSCINKNEISNLCSLQLILVSQSRTFHCGYYQIFGKFPFQKWAWRYTVYSITFGLDIQAHSYYLKLDDFSCWLEPYPKTPKYNCCYLQAALLQIIKQVKVRVAFSKSRRDYVDSILICLHSF